MPRKVLINGKWPLILPDSSADEWEGNMAHHGQWEMPRLLALEKLIKGHARWSKYDNAKSIVLYIGAYKGDMPALLASWGARVILMESTPAFWTLIKEVWELNNLPKPIGFWSGLVSNRTTGFNSEVLTELTEWPTRTAEYIEGKVGFSHLAESRDDDNYPEITIDHFLAQLRIVPDIITMDVEGSELEILKGAINTIEKTRSTFMLSVHPEFMFHNHGSYERELHDLLQHRGYRGTWIDYDHEHHWLYQKDAK